MAILACAQFAAAHATKSHYFGYGSARASGDLFDVRNGPNSGDAVLTVNYQGNLAVDGTFTPGGVNLAPNGAVGAPSFSWANSPTTGFYRIGADNIGLSVAGTKRWDFAATISTLTGALTVSGTTILQSTLAVSSTVTGGTYNGQTISAAASLTGSLAVATTLGVTGNFTVNTNKFSVAAASGNTLVAGTFDVSGAMTANVNGAAIAIFPATLAAAVYYDLRNSAGVEIGYVGFGSATSAGSTMFVSNELNGPLILRSNALTALTLTGANAQFAGTLGVTGAVTITGSAGVGFDVYGAGRDRFQVQNEGAGSGVSLFGLNNGGTDFEPLTLGAESIDLRYRNGVATTASALTLDSNGATIPVGLQLITDRIRRATSDGADNSTLLLCAGGAFSNTRGSLLHLHGNEHANTGALYLEAGDVAGGEVKIFTIGGAEAARFDRSVTATHTRFMIYDVDNATLERVTVGAADSGGGGFKVLRIPN